VQIRGSRLGLFPCCFNLRLVLTCYLLWCTVPQYSNIRLTFECAGFPRNISKEALKSDLRSQKKRRAEGIGLRDGRQSTFLEKGSETFPLFHMKDVLSEEES